MRYALVVLLVLALTTPASPGGLMAPGDNPMIVTYVTAELLTFEEGPYGDLPAAEEAAKSAMTRGWIRVPNLQGEPPVYHKPIRAEFRESR